MCQCGKPEARVRELLDGTPHQDGAWPVGSEHVMRKIGDARSPRAALPSTGPRRRQTEPPSRRAAAERSRLSLAGLRAATRPSRIVPHHMDESLREAARSARAASRIPAGAEQAAQHRIPSRPVTALTGDEQMKADQRNKIICRPMLMKAIKESFLTLRHRLRPDRSSSAN